MNYLNFCGKKLTDFPIFAKKYSKKIVEGGSCQCELFMGWCGLIWTFMGRCGSLWTFMGGCKRFMGQFALVWVGGTFLWVGVGRCDLFRGRYGTVWVVVTFLWVGVGRSGSMWLGLGQSGKWYNQYGNVYGSVHERVMRCIEYPLTKVGVFS